MKIPHLRYLLQSKNRKEPKKSVQTTKNSSHTPKNIAITNSFLTEILNLDMGFSHLSKEKHHIRHYICIDVCVDCNTYRSEVGRVVRGEGGFGGRRRSGHGFHYLQFSQT